jgi:hypothetical protein
LVAEELLEAGLQTATEKNKKMPGCTLAATLTYTHMKPTQLESTTNGEVRSVRFSRAEWAWLEKEGKDIAHTPQKVLRFLVVHAMKRGKK